MDNIQYELYTPGYGEVVVKKSKFIGQAFGIKDETDITSIISKTKKEFYDARHHCFAYCLADENAIRSSDDGEPSGTAGRPILDVILGANMRNTLVVVTRYFGGVLLGTGGLTRAYTNAAKEALNNSVKIERKSGIKLTVTLGYEYTGKTENIIKESKVFSLPALYEENVTYSVLADINTIDNLLEKITAISNGSVKFERSGIINYGITDEGVVWL